MAIKAKKLASKKGLKQSLSSDGNKFAQRVPEEGIIVRFLTEPEEWWEVELHYGEKTSFPCNGDDGCLGCDEGMDKGRKWYASAYVPDDDRIVVFEMGKSVVEEISRKYDRNHTVMDRDFEITKEGTGMRTRYFVDAHDPRHVKGLDKMEPIDMEEFFEEWLKRAGLAGRGYSPHKLRHTFASIAITSGADVASVSEKLGHSDKAVTLRMYTHADQESMKRASQIFRDALKQDTKKAGQG